jgi:hypothetical protein
MPRLQPAHKPRLVVSVGSTGCYGDIRSYRPVLLGLQMLWSVLRSSMKQRTRAFLGVGVCAGSVLCSRIVSLNTNHMLCGVCRWVHQAMQRNHRRPICYLFWTSTLSGKNGVSGCLFLRSLWTCCPKLRWLVCTTVAGPNAVYCTCQLHTTMPQLLACPPAHCSPNSCVL